MKIVKLSAENVKRLRAVEITPDGNVQVIAGRNGQGKTSVLDSIWFALGGGPAAKGTTMPIRNGETTAQVTVDLGELRVTRTWKGDKTTLKVESADGAQYKSPQAMLDSLVGRLSFDPLAFAQQDERTQLATLLELVDLPFDVDELASRRATLYAQRTEVGRHGKQLDGQLAGTPTPPDDTPAAEISISELTNDYRAANAKARELADINRRANELDRERSEALNLVASLEERLDAARARVATIEDDIASAEATLSASEVPDVAAIELRLAGVADINANVRARQQREELAAKLKAARNQFFHLGAQITALDEQKSTAIAAAKMPIDGLAFDDTGVTYRDVPFKQCSAAEQLRVSLAMSMAMNPKIRVIRITDGSLLDSQNMALIEQMATDQDFQVWIERVDESGRVGIVIEDGLVAP